MFRRMVFGFVAAVLAFPAVAAELVMMEQDRCFYCELWHEQIAPVYPKTAEGNVAPSRRIDVHEDYPADLNFTQRPHFTPTFVLVEDGQELARIEGNRGEDFFWRMLSDLMRREIGLEEQS